MINQESYTPEFRAKVVLEVLKKEKSMEQVASENGVSLNLIAQWKEQFMEGSADIFRNKRKAIAEKESAHEKKCKKLNSEISKLTTQLNWLKKKAGGIFEQI
jgi:transposase-like protein